MCEEVWSTRVVYSVHHDMEVRFQGSVNISMLASISLKATIFTVT